MFKHALAAAAFGAAFGTAFSLPVLVTAQPAGADAPVNATINSEGGTSYRAVELLESKVSNEQGETLADVEDFILDSESNQVRYVVLSRGKAPPPEAVRLYVVPASQFFVHRDSVSITLQTPLTSAAIERAPSFSKAQFINAAWRSAFIAGIDEFWTGVGVNQTTNRGFGLRGQIDAVGVSALTSPNRPNPELPGIGRLTAPGESSRRSDGTGTASSNLERSAAAAPGTVPARGSQAANPRTPTAGQSTPPGGSPGNAVGPVPGAPNPNATNAAGNAGGARSGSGPTTGAGSIAPVGGAAGAGAGSGGGAGAGASGGAGGGGGS